MTAQAADALKAGRRWAVTGTPVQNGLSDMFSLFHFIQVYPYSDRSIVDKHIFTPWTIGDREDAIKRLKKLLQYIMLRRSADIITLPERTDTTILLKFDAQERAKYQQSAQATIQCLDDLLYSKATAGGHKNALNKINALRMACNLGCQRLSKFQDSLKPPNLSSRQTNVLEGSESGIEASDCLKVLAFIGVCKACGISISNSEFLIPEASGDRGPQPWCSSCLLDLTESVEKVSEPDFKPLECTSVQAGAGKQRQWPTKIGALLEDVRNQDSDTKWLVASYPQNCRCLNR